ncbi:unnamed protein product [Clavelina lepadiformis]|uniref:Uncharacterized protein n=1 Tax=Clavelina lepadiformis TaxID=159417 RepID=A0ABP0H373_CLALP
MQLGHEPLPPIMRRNIFFRKQLQYPTVFEYMKHIQRRDGYAGLYRGLMPRILANVTTSLSYTYVSHTLKPKEDKDSCSSEEEPNFSEVCTKTSQEMMARCAAVIISQPLHVIAIRTMAQFVGHEEIYNNIYSSVVEIYHEEGILGFFAGLAPRLASEVISIWLCSVLTYAVNTYILTDTSELKDLRQYTTMAVGYLIQTIVYPLSITSTVMATNGARIQAGCPPFVPKYENWVACLRDLKKSGTSGRGSSMLFRKAVGHVVAASSVTPVPAPTFS